MSKVMIDGVVDLRWRVCACVCVSMYICAFVRFLSRCGIYLSVRSSVRPSIRFFFFFGCVVFAHARNPPKCVRAPYGWTLGPFQESSPAFPVL